MEEERVRRGGRTKSNVDAYASPAQERGHGLERGAKYLQFGGWRVSGLQVGGVVSEGQPG